MKHGSVLIAGILATAAPAQAASPEFGAIVRGELGYGTNPFLRQGITEGSLFASGTVAPRLTYRESRSTTTLAGSYTRDQYFDSLGYTDSLSASVTRFDQLAQNLSSTITADYVTSNRAIDYGVYDVSDEPLVDDPLSIGQRTHRYGGNYQLQWQATAVDQLRYGASYSHLSYGGGARGALVGASGYDQYGVNGAYGHALDARTTVGAQISLNAVRSKFYPDSRSIEPGLTIHRQLDAVWTIDGNVGLVLQRTYGPLGGSSTSLGYGVDLCGKYPRTRVCISGSRGSQPSGFGGLRTSTQIRTTVSHDISEHSRINIAGSYSQSRALQGGALLPLTIRSTRAVFFTAEYDRDISRRVSAGLGGRYQWRDTSSIGTSESVAATVHITAKLGRI